MQDDFWNENSEAWTQVVDSTAIGSRKITSPAIVQAINELGIQSVLDVGCGEGWLGRALPEKIQYLGIDGSSGLIEKANSRSHHQFEMVSYADLGGGRWQANKKFEGIVFNFSLLDKDIGSTLQSVQSFLKPEGVIVIQTIHPCFKLPKYEDAWFVEDFKTSTVTFKNTMPWYGRTLSSWIDLFRQSGLRLERLMEPRTTENPTSVIFVLKRL